MRRLWLLIALLAAALLTACGQAGASPQATATAQQEAMECTLSTIFPEARDLASVNLPAISGEDWSRGPEKALLTILVYSDFQCPYCSLAGRYLKEFGTAHPDEVRVVYRHFPLSSHDKALISAQAAEAAGLQGKFWEMHDLLVAEENWEAWRTMAPSDFETWIVEQAASIGLDTAQFREDLTAQATVAKVAQTYQAALDVGLNSTPSLYYFLNGELIFIPADQVPYNPVTLETILKVKKMEGMQYAACPPMVIDPAKQYTATIKTEKGDIVVNLYADKAPLAVNSFVFLAREGFYDNITFHRVLKDFVAQSGDPSGSGAGGPGYVFANEISEDLKFDRAGLLGMANAGVDTNGSQFFITYKDLPDLDGRYPIFGEVAAGMDVVQQLTLRNQDASEDVVLPPGDRVIGITIEEK